MVSSVECRLQLMQIKWNVVFDEITWQKDNIDAE